MFSARCFNRPLPNISQRLTLLYQSCSQIAVRSCSTSFVRAMSYTLKEFGGRDTKEYQGYFTTPDGNFISPFHDIPLHANDKETSFNMVVEIPRWTNAKMEINRESDLNPIKQDLKNGKLRYVSNVFPYHGYIWNYGALPQTWEDPAVVDSDTQCKGDNDPIDVCEIGTMVAARGDVIQVKVLGVMALIDEGETDWKVIAIDLKDPLAPKLNDISDVDTHMPGLLKATHEWFRVYKMPTGKPENKFAFKGKAKDKAFALKKIADCNAHWKKMMDPKETSSLARSNTTLKNGLSISSSDAKKITEKIPSGGSAGTVSPDVDKWHYV